MSVILGDCVEEMAKMEADSVDAIVTDPLPPYGLEFMGKTWDRLGDGGKVKHTGPTEHRATEAGDVYGRLRVSSYGSANRKCRSCGHWEWSGTPCKCEKPDFPTREGRQGLLMQDWHAQWAEAAYRVAKPSAYLLAFGGTRTVHRMTCALEDAGWIIRDMLVWAYASGFPKSKASLKPAWEPIVMARKPGPLRELAIDACRIPGEPWVAHDATGLASVKFFTDGDAPVVHKEPHDGGRWPANVVLTDPIFDGGIAGVVGGGRSDPPGGPGRQDSYPSNGVTGWADGGEQGPLYFDGGTYSRFFLIPKAARSDREPVLGGLPELDRRTMSGGLTGVSGDRNGRGGTVAPLEMGNAKRQNVHPTVKPVELMRHLVRLVTPTGGTVLDPFAGSGSTLLAAEQEGFPWIGIEREAEYVAITQARLNGTQRGLGLPA